jgi:hypothetical protein
MKMNKLVLGSILGTSLLAGGVLIAAGQPGENVGRRHANLMAAQHLIDQAYQRISDAQAANEWDMHGHAAHAKELLDQANREIKLAAEDANHHSH